jgi:hypothetical protein
MKHAIFTGTLLGVRFYDAFTDEDIEVWEKDYYFEDDRFDFKITDGEIEAKMKEMSSDDEILDECIASLSLSDKKRFLRNLYRNETERVLITDAVYDILREKAIEDWKEECMNEVVGNYEGKHTVI